MIWGPFLLALALGLVVSAGLYFAYMWPQVEPVDDDEPHAVVPSETATSEPANEPANEATTDAPSTSPEAESEAPPPTRESSPA